MGKTRKKLDELRAKWHNKKNGAKDESVKSTNEGKNVTEEKSEVSSTDADEMSHEPTNLASPDKEGSDDVGNSESSDNVKNNSTLASEGEVSQNVTSDLKLQNSVIIYENGNSESQEKTKKQSSTKESDESSDNKNDKKEKEEPSTKQVNNGAMLAVQGALYTCDKGVAPSQFQITHNTKLYAQNKLVITDKEVQFSTPVQPFGTCQLNPDTTSGKPCMYSNGQWKPNTLYKSNNNSLVTEDSEMLCMVFGCGTISNILPGQQVSVSKADIESADINENPVSPQIDTKSVADQNDTGKEEPFFVKSISVVGDQEKFAVTAEKYNNGEKSGDITVYKVRKGTSMSFEANVKSENVSWAVVRMKDNNVSLEKGKTFTKVFNEDCFVEGMGNKLFNGTNNLQRYNAIVGGSSKKKGPFDISCSVKVCAVENKIISVEGPDFKSGNLKKFGNNETCYVAQNKKISLKINLDVPYDPKYDCLTLKLKSGDTEVISDANFTFCESDQTIIFSPQNTETYYTIEVNLYELENEVIRSDKPISTYMVKMYCLCGMLRMECNPNNEYVRPGTIVEFILRMVQGQGPDLTKAKWTIGGKEVKSNVVEESSNETKDDKLIAELDTCDLAYEDSDVPFKEEQNKSGSDVKDVKTSTWDRFIYKFNTEGQFKVTANYEGIGLRSEDSKKEVTHVVNVKKQHITRVSVSSSTRSCHYVGVKYTINCEYFYRDIRNSDKSRYYKVEPGGCIDKSLLQDGILCFKKKGHYKISCGMYGCEKPVSTEINVVEPNVEMWGFFDTKDRPISIIGHGMKFRVKGFVPAWGEVVPSSKPSSSNRKIEIKFFCQKNYLMKKTADLTSDGRFSLDDIDLDNDLIKNNRHVFDGKNNKILTFVVCKHPDIEIACLSKPDGYNQNEGSIYKKSSLKVCNDMQFDGYFADETGERLSQILYYGETVKIHLHIVNADPEKLKRMTLRVYRNKYGLDKCVFNYNKIELDETGQVDIDLPTNKNNIKEKDHGESPLPRLFYFNLEIDVDYIPWDSVIYTYPPTHIYDFNVKKNEDEIKRQLDNEKKGTKANYSLLNNARSYFLQLKLVKKMEENDYKQTADNLAPVVLGEETKKKKKNNDESQSACKNCHEEYELMAKRLKEVFDKVDENKLKIIAQAYCDYQYKLCMDSCWAKAVFFAAVYVESGPNLTISKGEGFNYSVANLYYSGTFSCFKGNPSLCVEYGATNTSSCFKYTPSNKNIDTTSFPKNKIDTVEEEGKTSYIFKKDYIGKDKWDDKIHSHSCDSKKLANYVYSDRKDLGNNGGDDGWNFRGRGLCQITGRGAYTSIQNIMRSVGYNVDLENNPDLVVNDIRVATVSSMAFFVWKGLNMRNICDEYVDKNKIDFKKVGDDSDVKHGIDIVTRKMGNNPATSMKIKVGDENVSLLRNHRGKHLVFKDLMFEAFDLKNCQCKSVRTDGTGLITYHIYSNRRIEKHIPLNITNNNIYRYVYHTEKASYLIAERKVIRDGLYFNAKPVKVNDNDRKNTELIYTYNKKLPIVDGKDAYVKYRSNGVPEYVIVNAKDGSDFSDYLYRTDGRHTEVVRIDEVPKNSDEAIVDVVNQPGTLSFYVENEVFISYRVDLTQTERCYTNPTIMAIAIGILAEYGATKLTEVAKLYKDAYNSDKSDVRPVYSPHSYCRSQKEDNTTEPNFTFEGKFCRSGTGNVDKLGTGFPSQTHRNGMAFDFCYGKKSDDEKIIEIAKGYGFQNILCGTRKECQRKGAKNDTNHNNHIHLGGLKYYKVNRDSKGDLIITKEGAISRTPILCGPLDDKPWGLANYVEIKEKEEVKNEK